MDYDSDFPSLSSLREGTFAILQKIGLSSLIADKVEFDKFNKIVSCRLPGCICATRTNEMISKTPGAHVKKRLFVYGVLMVYEVKR